MFQSHWESIPVSHTAYIVEKLKVDPERLVQ